MATIDASIPLGVRQFEAPDQLNQLARIFQIQGLQKENQLGQLKMDEYQRSNQEMNALRSVLGQSGFSWENEANRNAAFGAAPLKAGELYEKYSKGREVQSKIKTEESKVLDEALARSRNALDTVVDAPGYIAWHEANHRDPVLGPWLASRGITPETSRAQIDAALSQSGGLEALIKRSALGMSKFTELNKPTYQKSDSGQVEQIIALPGLGGPGTVVNSVQKVADPNAVLSAETTRRGQNMVDARSREANAQGKTQIVETPQGFVIVDKNTGQSRPATGADGAPLKGKANDRVMTDAQAKANLFGTRMKESDRILSDLEGKYWPGAVNAKIGAGDVPVVGGVAGYAGNLMLSEKGQQAEQAQRDFINAVLRRESGAVISPAEFANAQKQYLPQSGDAPAVLAQKKRNRALAISGLEAEVPGGFRTSPSLTNPAGNTGGATGDFGGGWSIQKVN